MKPLWIIPIFVFFLVAAIVARDIHSSVGHERRYERLLLMMEDLAVFATEMRRVHNFMVKLPPDERACAHLRLIHGEPDETLSPATPRRGDDHTAEK